ncbi:MAG TPA: hypothetical protein VG711_05750, partial [Phycisphaerales bacterium]|nr:hypothetical protein [Phycisphaerales bacterium]
MSKSGVCGTILPLIAVTAVIFAGEARGTTVSLTAGHDTTLYEDPAGALGNGAGAYVFAGRTNTPTLRRALFWFDVQSVVPDGAVITNASLVLH